VTQINVVPSKCWFRRARSTCASEPERKPEARAHHNRGPDAPAGDILFTGCAGGSIVTHDIKPGSPGFHRLAQAPFSLFASGVYDLAITADGKIGFATRLTSGPLEAGIDAFVADPNHPLFGLAINVNQLRNTLFYPFQSERVPTTDT
jgi:hypothetical protein